MTNVLIRRLLILGSLAILGIIFIQSYMVLKTYELQDDEFHLSATTALRTVAERISTLYKTDLPKQDLITRRSSNYYAVNVNSEIDANVLEDYLIQEFEKHSLETDFEYAVYDCQSDSLLYGNYCNLTDNKDEVSSKESLPKFNDLIYYFVVRFPSRGSYLLSNMWQTILFSAIALLAILFFIYAITIILRQKQLTEQQKDFINNMTHEFKTPISSIKIASNVLVNNEAVQNDERMLQYANIIKHQNDRLNNQVEKVLNIARLEKDQFKLNKEDFNLKNVLQSIVNDEKIKVDKLGGEIQLLADGDIFIKADKLHFTNVISNIIDNAIKYCNDKPKISITLGKRGNNATISIQDNGIGISKEDQKKVFSKFFRVPTGDLHNIKGFGLGLHYVKTISEAHGWKLDLDSEESVGSKFEITMAVSNT